MARKPIKPMLLPVERIDPQPLSAPRICLTLTSAEPGQSLVKVGITEFITYSQKTGFTRLNLKGRKILDVKETTEQIDRLVRLASCQPYPVTIDPVVSESV